MEEIGMTHYCWFIINGKIIFLFGFSFLLFGCGVFSQRIRNSVYEELEYLFPQYVHA